MSDPDTRPVLSRIIAAHLGVGAQAAALEPALQSGLTRAIRRAAMPFATLTPQVAEVSVMAEARLSDALAAMPDHGLIAAMEDKEGRRGLVVLEHPLVDALIEVQATGHVEETEQPPRKVTRIDEALCRDFIDLKLGAFALETAEQAGRDWPDRMHYGSNIADRAQLNLLMPDRGYRLLRTSVTLGGRKTGTLVMLLPCDPAVARRRALVDPKAEAPVDWSAQMLACLGSAPMALDAVLMRVTLPLGEVEALEEGDLVPFDHSDLSAVTLEDETGHVFLRGALGQLSGKRAVRVAGPQKGAAAPQAPATPPAPASMPQAMAHQEKPGALADLPPMAEAPAPMGDLDPGAPAAGADPDVPPGAVDPIASMKDFDPNATMA
ncbi:FliM/FliN family flagellar motor switch protein [Gymnodinialimonas sp.]